MAANRSVAVWLQRLAGLLALAGALALSACGGGSGAPSVVLNPVPPVVPALVVLPSSLTVFTGIPSVLTISGGVPPYRAFSSNATVLPVSQTVAGTSVVLLASDVASDTATAITIQDSADKTVQAAVTVRPATLFNTFTVTPNRPECGASAICSGQTGTASIVVQAPGGGTAPGRQIRFDVVSGPFGIVTNNPGQPTAATLTVVSDAAGVAQVIIQANVDAPTQPAQLRATDLSSGQQRTAQFLIIQNTNGSTILTIIPPTATVTSPFKGECSAGARVDYFIYGGTPPYRVTSSFPDAAAIVNSTVLASGGFFEAVTNGTCVSSLTFSVLDATGRQTTATFNNVEGSAARPVAPPLKAISVTPSNVPATACTGKTFQFLVVGGEAPYTVVVNPQGALVTLSPGTSGTYQISGITLSGIYQVIVGDGAGTTPQTATINCT